MEKTAHQDSTFYTWMIVILMLVGILAKGLFTFFVVGDLGQPTWDYRPIKDVPGQSPYAIYQKLPHYQHVRGEKGE